MATILLIEDDPDAAHVITQVLRTTPEQFRVIAVGTGHAAYGALAAESVDCVLLDYRLPDTDGLQCLATLRRRHPDVPVVVITGEGSEDVAVEAMKLGASDYVVKHARYH